MQTVVCKVQQCGFRGKNGFCLNKLTAINQRGMCDWIGQINWDQPVPEEEKNSNFWKQYKQQEEIKAIEEKEWK